MDRKSVDPFMAIAGLLLIALIFWTGVGTILIGAFNVVRWIFGF